MALHEVTAWAARANANEFEGMTWSTLATPYHPLSTLREFVTDGWNHGQVSDPKYDALYESMEPLKLEELGEYSKQADLYMISQHWQLWGPVEPSYNVTQPWVKGHNGEYYMGAWNWNAVYARVWIDQNLKEQMGF